MFTVKKVTVNYQTNAVGVIKQPQFGWVLVSDRKNVLQESYFLQLSRDQGFAEIGWIGEFISAETAESGGESRGSCFRKEIIINKPVKEAYAFTTALGVYHFFLNGKRVGRDEMAPGWTAYQKRLLYQTNDVTEYLKQGKNAIGAMVGAGWYKGTVSFRGVRNHYGKQTAFSTQICIRYEDGTEDWIVSDLSWKCQASPVTYSEIYNGEIYDARYESPGWDLPKFNDADWYPVEKVSYKKGNLEPQDSGAVWEKEELVVKRIITTPKGEIVLDFGQNMTGWVRFKVKAERGDKVHLRFFEVLDSKGNVYTENLRMAKQEIVYICRGGVAESYRPYFSFQGFQYVQVLEYPGEILPENFTACVAYSNMEETGMFSCSNKLVNQLQHNILWGMKGNFFDIPTDCPQRDERLGWTGDAQVFAGTAMWLMNTCGFFKKWLRDLASEQREDGAVPFTAPHVLEHVQPWEEQGNPTFAAAAWADAAVIIPWNLHLAYGDVQVIKEQYDSMRGWIEFMRVHAKEGIWSYYTQFGDHLSLDPEDENGNKATPPELVCCAFYAYSSELFAKMAKACGKDQDYVEYFQLSREIREAFVKHFFDGDGRMKVQTQTAHVLALHFHLVPEEYKKKTIDSLVELIEAAGGHLRTGFVGTPYLCHVLSRNGHAGTAYELLLKEDFPSWLYQVKQGATTIWEHWDGIRPAGSMWAASMNSFNHYAYGAIGEWLYREVAGINTDEEEPGYKRIIIRPVIGGELVFAEGSYNSVYGEIKSSWSREGQRICLDVEIPVNTSAVGWSKLVAIYAIPLCVFALGRFVFVKENPEIDARIETDKVTLKDVWMVFTKNKYVWFYGGMILLFNTLQNMTVQTYYFTYIVGNTDMLGILSIMGIMLLPVMLFMPLVLKKFSVSQVIIGGAVIAIIGYVVNFFAGANIGMLCGAGVLNACVNLPVAYLCSVLLMDLFNYNEYKGLARLEGTTNQLAHGITTQIGQGVGGFLLGVLLDAGGFIAAESGTEVVQPESAINMIRAMYSIVPIILLGLLIVCVVFLNKLDKEMPEIEKALIRH